MDRLYLLLVCYFVIFRQDGGREEGREEGGRDEGEIG